MAGGNSATFLEYANLDAEFTQHVEGYGLVRSPRSQPAISIGLVETYLRKQSTAATLSSEPSDPEEVVAEISRRRYAIEIKLRQLIGDGLRFKYGKRAGAQALKALPENRRGVLSQYSFSEIWEHSFFLELITLIDKEWDVFQNWFSQEKGDVLSWLQHINRCRADAHAKTLAADDNSYLRVCFLRLEESLSIER